MLFTHSHSVTSARDIHSTGYEPGCIDTQSYTIILNSISRVLIFEKKTGCITGTNHQKPHFETEIHIFLFSFWALLSTLRSSGTITRKPTKDSHIWDIIHNIDSHIISEISTASKCRNHPRQQISIRPHLTNSRIAATIPPRGILLSKLS